MLSLNKAAVVVYVGGRRGSSAGCAFGDMAKGNKRSSVTVNKHLIT